MGEQWMENGVYPAHGQLSRLARAAILNNVTPISISSTSISSSPATTSSSSGSSSSTAIATTTPTTAASIVTATGETTAASPVNMADGPQQRHGSPHHSPNSSTNSTSNSNNTNISNGLRPPPAKSVVRRALGNECPSPPTPAPLPPAAVGPSTGTTTGTASTSSSAPHQTHAHAHAQPQAHHPHGASGGVGKALSDTPVSTAPPSPQIRPKSSSGSSTPRPRATTLDIPGLTKSKVSPDGRIAQRDVGSKLVVVMVGLPARGKSYITKKLARYLNWLQHDCKIFNVGQRRRVFQEQTTTNNAHEPPAASSSPQPTTTTAETSIDQNNNNDEKKDPSLEHQLRHSVRELAESSGGTTQPNDQHDALPPPALPSAILVNGQLPPDHPQHDSNPSPMTDIGQRSPPNNDDDNSNKDDATEKARESPQADQKQGLQEGRESQSKQAVERADDDRSRSIDQPASFFDPHNESALRIREQIALSTLDELLNYILDEGGSVGILDATNSTLDRRAALIDHIRRRAGPELNVLFLESQCFDDNLLQANMRLKLSGPDYRDKDPDLALDDFKRRMALYEESYVPLGEFEETHDIPFLKVIDVSRKLVTHQVNGFLSSQVVYYLLNFNLTPRQIWITRHGESQDDVQGKIGGDADLSPNGVRYARALTRFINDQRSRWQDYQRRKSLSVHFPPMPGDSTPPNPQYASQTTNEPNFCVWTGMMQRAQQTAQFFDEDVYDVKEMRMLDEMNVGRYDGMTYTDIQSKYPEDYERRKKSKLHYRYPGTGGEGYLDLINRLKAVIVEVERMTDHALIVTHRSVARVLLAYFLGLKRENLTDLEIPLGVVYCLEPKTYGVEFKMYRYDPDKNDFFVWSNENFERAAYR